MDGFQYDGSQIARYRAIELAGRVENVTIDALEIQQILAQIAREQVVAAGFSEQIRVIVADIRQLPGSLVAGSYDRVFANPPFFEQGKGRLPPDPVRAAARFEQNGGLGDFIAGGHVLLQDGGVLHIIQRPERRAELFSKLIAKGFAICRCVEVLARPGSAAVLVMVAAKKGPEQGREPQAEQIHLMDEDGQPVDYVQSLMVACR